MSRHARLAGLAAGLLAAACGGSAVAMIVVLESHGPAAATYPSGMILRSDQWVTLGPNDDVQIMDESGQRTLRGPLKKQAGALGEGRRTSVRDMITRANARLSEVAATRGFSLGQATGPASVPLWRLDVADWQAGAMDRGGQLDFCLAGDAAPDLVFKPAAADRTLSIYNDDGPTVIRTLKVPAGATQVAWPAELPAVDGATYRINLGEAGGAALRWRRAPATVDGLEALVDALAAKGCTEQLSWLAAVDDGDRR